MHTSNLARALVRVYKSVSSFQPAAVAIAILTKCVASEGCGGALTISTRVTTCASVTIVTCHALAICPCACAAAWITPLKNKQTSNSHHHYSTCEHYDLSSMQNVCFNGLTSQSSAVA